MQLSVLIDISESTVDSPHAAPHPRRLAHQVSGTSFSPVPREKQTEMLVVHGTRPMAGRSGTTGTGDTV